MIASCMPLASRRPVTRSILFDRALESLPLFRLSDSADDGPVQFANLFVKELK